MRPIFFCYKNICLSAFIICNDGTAESTCAGITRTFQEAQGLLRGWRSVAERMFPDDTALLEEIPHPNRVGLERLVEERPWILTDGCPAATLFRDLFEKN